MALSIDNITWPLALIILAVILGTVGIFFVYFKYRKQNSKPEPFYRILLLGLLLIFIIFLLDIIDILPPDNGWWLKEKSYGIPNYWIILIIVGIIVIAGYYAIKKLSPLGIKKQYKKAIEQAEYFTGVKTFTPGSGTVYPLERLRALEAEQKDSNNNGITYFILRMSDRHIIIIGINAYTGECADFTHLNKDTSLGSSRIVEWLDKKNVILTQEIKNMINQEQNDNGDETV